MSVERAIIASVIVDGRDALDTIGIDIGPLLADARHREILAAAMACKTIDLVSIEATLTRTGKLPQAGGVDYLMGLLDAAPMSVTQLPDLAAQMAQIASDRHLAEAVTEVYGKLRSGRLDYDDARDRLSHALANDLSVSDDVSLPTAAEIDALILQAERIARGEATAGMSFGFKDIDQYVTMQPGDLIIIAARTSIGKSAFCTSMLWRTSIPSLLASLEMSREQINERFLSLASSVPPAGMHGRLRDGDIERMRGAKDRVSQIPCHICDKRSLTVEGLRRRASRLVRDFGIQLVVVDYLQLLQPSVSDRTRSRENEVAAMSAALKAMAGDLKVAVIAVCQLNRDAEGNEPTLRNLRESGAIEQDADTVLLLHRDRYKTDQPTKVIIAKNRRGPCGTAEIEWQPEIMSFGDMTMRQRWGGEI